MTGVAIGFELGMRIAERTRRDQPFHNALCRRHLRRNDQPDKRKEAKPEAHQYIWTATMWMIAVPTRMKNSGR